MKKYLILKIMTLCFVLVILPITANSYIHQNGAGGGYDGSGSSGEAAVSNVAIDFYIIEGAGYFFNGSAEIHKLLNRIEMSDLKGIDYDELKGIVYMAITNLSNAKATYEMLISSAERTPYNEEVISKLISFDYEKFMENNSMNESIFKDVEKHLKNGDITGTFKRSYSSFNKILTLLNAIKEDVSLNRLPQLSDLWKLNHETSTELLFGQYEAQVFMEIL